MAEAPETDMPAAIISSAAPDATTASLAADVQIEHATISSVAPELSTATAELTQAVSTPGPSDVPGGFPETPATEITEPAPIVVEEQVFSVKPFPASDTPTNPFHLDPGQPIPQNEFTVADINRHVKLDEESYQRADASNLGFGLNGAPVLPEVVTPAAVRETEGRGVLDIPSTTVGMIPESSLPITSFASVTTILETPEIVEEIQGNADVEPETLIVEAIVERKEEFVVPAATTVGGIMAAAGIASASGEPNDETTPAVVPEIVRDSQKLAHVEPEASAVEEVVEAKREFEEELKRERAPVTLDAEPAVKPAPVHHAVVEPIEPAIEVPVIVQRSLAESGTAPEAASITEAVKLKKVVEEELKEEVKPTEAETLVVPTKSENGVALNGNGTSAKSEKSEKETEANGNGTKSPKKSFENGDAGELKKSKRKSFFGSLKDKFFHTGTGAKDKGKAKGEISP